MDGCRAWYFWHVVGLPTLYLRHMQDHVPLSSKPSTACSHQSSEAQRTEETSHVQDSLLVNGYPTKLIENAAQPRSGPQSHHPDPAGLAVVRYVQGVSDRVKSTLQHFNIKTAFKPYTHLLLSSKNRRTVHQKKK